ncbi:ESX secretion-associated protein EspG [Actinophytocola xanthii]|uniref:ESX secretion-associated protein EspG n=1 Tax=Actinophytocola xanthii TaxID=1912961 RepID=A0A1Q8CAJ4_9PSEU|nr:ESX secretion-associated protein EspG [Actinophytocola xanthii]OLF11387.1 ESX secretion-associated protein EspG [Actinophytocola xanthii]
MTLGSPTGTADPITISTLEFDVLWEQRAPEEMPLVLRVPSPGRTDLERNRLVRQAWSSLEARGLGGPVNLDPRLAHLISLLRRPDREVDGRLWLGSPLRVLAAATGEEAVLATLSGSSLTLGPAEASGLPRYALSVLPPAPAGPGRSLTLPTADFEAAAHEATGRTAFEAALIARGVRQADSAELATMIGDIVRQGQFGSAARDRWGRRVRAPRVLSFFDTPDGRYLHLRSSAPDAEPWTTISPADHRRLLQHLTALHGSGSDEDPDHLTV